MHQRCFAIIVQLVDLRYTLRQQLDHSQPVVAAPISAVTSLFCNLGRAGTSKS